jgi:curved DNA-binding protein CbpA
MSIDDKTYYQYLNLSSTCEQNQIRINYQKLALLVNIIQIYISKNINIVF